MSKYSLKAHSSLGLVNVTGTVPESTRRIGNYFKQRHFAAGHFSGGVVVRVSEREYVTSKRRLAVVRKQLTTDWKIANHAHNYFYCNNIDSVIRALKNIEDGVGYDGRRLYLHSSVIEPIYEKETSPATISQISTNIALATAELKGAMLQEDVPFPKDADDLITIPQLEETARENQ